MTTNSCQLENYCICCLVTQQFDNDPYKEVILQETNVTPKCDCVAAVPLGQAARRHVASLCVLSDDCVLSPAVSAASATCAT